jgi:hypothetical protein
MLGDGWSSAQVSDGVGIEKRIIFYITSGSDR